MYRLLKKIVGRMPGLKAWRDQYVEDILTRMSGEISLQEARFLVETVRNLPGNGPIIEIGTLFGFSTGVLAIGKKEGQALISVDNYCWDPYGLPPDAHERVTRHRLGSALADGSVTLIRSEKNDFFQNYDMGKPEMVFLDADHSYEETKKDILWARSVGAGVIAGHDYDKAIHPGIVRAVEEQGGIRQLRGTIFILNP